MLPERLCALAEQTLAAARARKLTIVTAESCTGGLIAGSSDVVERGFVTYSNSAKSEALGVPPSLIETHGAVSEEVARAMAEGALRHSRADLAVAVTGVAGPGGGTAAKPVGLVHLALARRGGATEARRMLYGEIGRSRVREETVGTALEMLLAAAG
jgi:nicotinamide-nucleotide amidase